MLFSVIHPSRSRPERAYNVFREWLSKCDNPKQGQYIISIDFSDPLKDRYVELFQGSGANVRIGNNKTAIEAINNVAKNTIGNLLIVVSDDYSCPNHWDTLLFEALEGKEDYCVKTQDGLEPVLMTLPVMDRKYFNRFGYIYYPGYRHLFADTEMTAVAHLLGKAISVPILFEHLHFSAGKSEKDSVNDKNNKTWNHGKMLFNNRLKTNFSIPNPVMKYKNIVWHP